jgi:hypothetical protein
MRRLGVYGENLPTKKSLSVSASDFLIGGVIFQSERKYNKAFEVTNPSQFQEIFGTNISSSWYGGDAIKGFFDNIVGVTAKIYCKSYVGNTGSAIDAVVALATINDQDGTPDPTLKIQAAYRGELEYGISGNRTGYKITNGYRFQSKTLGSQDTAHTYVLLLSAVGIQVGDIIKIEHTSAIYKKVTDVDEALAKVSFADALGATVADAVAVGVMGIRIQTYRKDTKGVVTEVEEDLGRIYCTLEAEVSEFYVNNVHANNKWAKMTDLASATTPVEKTYPADVSTVAYLLTGADGTAASDSSWIYLMFTAFDSYPIRFLCNPETTSSTINKAGETYCASRWDNPKWIYNIPENQTKAQLIVIGNGYQRNGEVFGVIVANWLGVTDPFVSGVSPDRHVPNVGHVMGAWIQSIAKYGIHYVPAVRSIALNGVNSIIGDQLTNDLDRTDVATAGVNMIQELIGFGMVIRNFFTPSTATEFKFANGGLMKSYIKVSAVDSLQQSENTPNSFARIKADASAIYMFLLNLWNIGSTSSAPLGETFGISENEDGSYTKFDDHVEVKADIVNNPQASINLGERTIDVYFTYPAPAGSIKIGVGILLR